MFLSLLIGSAELLLGLLSYALATTVIVRLLAHLIRQGFAEVTWWKNVVLMILVALVTTLAHLVQIALWALAFLLCGQIGSWEEAFYYSAENYTSLGYGDIVLKDGWRLLGPLEAINGLLLFGLSTGVMLAVMSRLIARRVHQELISYREGNTHGAGVGRWRSEIGDQTR